MIIRSICIWVALLFTFRFVMPSTVEEHEQKLSKLNERITRSKAAYRREKNLKAVLLKQHQELSIKIDREIERGDSVQLLLGVNIKTESPRQGKCHLLCREGCGKASFLGSNTY